MDVQKLDYFLAAADTENFTQAADQCGIAQTTMSKYIHQLEKEFNCRLFYRTNKGCGLTEQGQIFYDKAVNMQKCYQDLMNALHQDCAQELNLSLDGAHFFLRIFKDFQNTYSNVRLNVAFDTEKNLVNDLLHRRVHAIVLPSIINTNAKSFPEFKSVSFLRAQEYLVFPAGTIDRYGSIPKAIQELPFITKSPDKSYYSYCQHQLAARYGTTFEDVRNVKSQDAQNMLLSLSQGFAIVPLSELSTALEVEYFPLGEDFLEMLQLFYNPQNMNHALELLLQFMENYGIIEY